MLALTFPLYKKSLQKVNSEIYHSSQIKTEDQKKTQMGQEALLCESQPGPLRARKLLAPHVLSPRAQENGARGVHAGGTSACLKPTG